MKAVVFLFFLCITSFNCKAQEKDIWKQFLEDSIYKSDDNNYIYLYKTKAGVKQKLLRFSLKGGHYVISTIYGDTLADTKTIISPNLFQIVYEHYDNLKVLPHYLSEKNFFKKHVKDFKNDSINYTQLGIRYYQLHFNHFPKFTEKQILNAKRNIADAMTVVNDLYKVLEAFESKQEKLIFRP